MELINPFEEIIQYRDTVATDFPDEFIDIDEDLRDPTKWKVM